MSRRNSQPPPIPRALCVVYAPLLARLHSDPLEPDEEEAIQQHVAGCSWCQAKLVTLDLVDDALRRQFGSLTASYRTPTREEIMSTANQEPTETKAPSREEIATLFARPPHRKMPLMAAGVAAVLVIAAVIAGITLNHSKTPHAAATTTARSHVSTIRLPSSQSHAESLTGGADGNLWFTDPGANSVGYSTPDGTVKEFSLPTSHDYLTAITQGPDGNFWFAEYQPPDGVSGNSSKGPSTTPEDLSIGRVTPTGSVTEYALPASIRHEYSIGGFAAGRDGNLWFTYGRRSSRGGVGYITMSGKVVIEPAAFLESVSNPVVGSDGNLWFIEEAFASQPDGSLAVATSDIVRLTPTGVVSKFPLSTQGDLYSLGIVSGPQGNLWYTRYSGSPAGDAPSTLESISPTGVITQRILPLGAGYVSQPIVGPDGNLWAIAPTQQELVWATPDGKITSDTIGAASPLTDAIASVGGYVWIATRSNIIVRYAV